jgi:uncharacterized repeat protein (TIGR01451 family)
MRPLAGLVVGFALSGMPFPAGALPENGAVPAPAARDLGRAFAALTRPAGRAQLLPDAGCHFHKRWTKTELMILSGKLPAPQRLILLQHFSDDAFLASAGILLANAGQLCDCPVNTTPATDVGVTKSASLPTVLAGQPLTYTLQVSNFGPNTANSVSVSDPLAASLSFVSSVPGSPTCTLSGSTFSCSLGSMLPGASQTITLNVTVSPSAPGGSLANTASVSTTTADTYAPNNSQTATVTVTPLQPGRVPDTLLLRKNTGNASLLDLSWTASCGNAVTGYGVYQGTLGTFYSHAPLNGLCAVAGLSAGAQPTAAVSSYYLIVPQSSSMEGSYGVNSSGIEIPPSGAPCRATQAFGGVCP